MFKVVFVFLVVEIRFYYPLSLTDMELLILELVYGLQYPSNTLK